MTHPEDILDRRDQELAKLDDRQRKRVGRLILAFNRRRYRRRYAQALAQLLPQPIIIMTSQGLTVHEATLRLNALRFTLLNPGPALRREYERRGWRADFSLLAARDVIDIVRLLDRAAEGNKEKLAAWFPDVRALGAFLALRTGTWGAI